MTEPATVELAGHESRIVRFGSPDPLSLFSEQFYAICSCGWRSKPTAELGRVYKARAHHWKEQGAFDA